MELDARRLEAGTRLDADICIIGAGPAGLTLARELNALSRSVILLESGGLDFDDEHQTWNDGVVIGSPYHGLRATRHRQVGGSANLWNTWIQGVPGAKYVPLDQIDLEPRHNVPYSGWPFDRPYLEPFYERAHTVCGLGPCYYESAHWTSLERQRLPVLDADELTTRVYHVGPGNRFTATYATEIRTSANIRLIHHATCCALITNGKRRVAAAFVRSATNTESWIDARLFVLAAGAIENARLLLVSSRRDAALGNEHGWVGRGFMEHPRDYTLSVVPRSTDLFHEIGFYDLHRPPDNDAWIIGRLALGESAMRSHGFPNASLTLLPERRHPSWRDVISRALGPRDKRIFPGRATIGYGWSRSSGIGKRCGALQVLMNLEQRPHPDNRVALSAARDPFGVPRAELHWRWRDEEQASLVRLRAFVVDRLNAVGLGEVRIASEALPDPNAHHHAGTTRLSVDPRRGVADADCRVHGTENLYVAGASVFPTAGFANPTLTIVALAVRLADHLKAREA